jgi:hypothetical protein
LNVTRVWKILARPDSESLQEWGLLEADYHWTFEFKEKIEKEKDSDDNIFGQTRRSGRCSSRGPAPSPRRGRDVEIGLV